MEWRLRRQQWTSGDGSAGSLSPQCCKWGYMLTAQLAIPTWEAGALQHVPQRPQQYQVQPHQQDTGALYRVIPKANKTRAEPFPVGYFQGGYLPWCPITAYLVGASAGGQADASSPGHPCPGTDSALATLLGNGLAWLHSSPPPGRGYGSLGSP